MYSTKMGSNVKFSISQIAFVLLTISMFGGLFFAVWNLHSQSASLKTDQITELQSLKDDNRNQKMEMRSLKENELKSLKSANENLQNQISEL